MGKFSQLVMGVGLVGGGFFVVLGYDSLLDWRIAAPLAVTLLGSWFLNEVKNSIKGAESVKRSAKLIRYKQKAALERKIGEMSREGWKPKFESYRETETGLLNRKTWYSVMMEKEEEDDRKRWAISR